MSQPNHPHDDELPITHRIGKTLRRHRLRQGRTLEDVAKAAGISPMGLHFIETQLRHPLFSTAERISQALGMNLAVVVVEAATEPPPED